MVYLDCYAEHDLQGHPAATYLDDSGLSIDTVVAYLSQWFQRVEVVEQSNGQAIRPFSESFEVSEAFLRLFNTHKEGEPWSPQNV